MAKSIEFIKRHAAVIGIVLMFALTWPIDLSYSGLMPFQVSTPVALLVGYGFVVASILMTFLTLGKAGVIKLLKRFLVWRVELRWYLAAFLIMPAIELTAVLLSALFTQTPIDFSHAFANQIFGSSANLPLFIVPFFVFDVLTNGEEIGWRGYLLPRLQAKHNALTATLILGPAWALWHLPKYLSHWDMTVFIWSVIDILAEAVLLTWLYNNTRGSLLLATLFHASGNTAGVFLPVMNTVDGGSLTTAVMETLVAFAAAVIVILAAGPEHLSRTCSREVLDEQPAPIQKASESGALFVDTHEKVIPVHDR